jgi:hypothetical protein
MEVAASVGRFLIGWKDKDPERPIIIECPGEPLVLFTAATIAARTTSRWVDLGPHHGRGALEVTAACEIEWKNPGTAPYFFLPGSAGSFAPRTVMGVMAIASLIIEAEVPVAPKGSQSGSRDRKPSATRLTATTREKILEVARRDWDIERGFTYPNLPVLASIDLPENGLRVRAHGEVLAAALVSYPNHAWVGVILGGVGTRVAHPGGYVSRDHSIWWGNLTLTVCHR